jgi:hypothetical protein
MAVFSPSLGHGQLRRLPTGRQRLDSHDDRFDAVMNVGVWIAVAIALGIVVGVSTDNIVIAVSIGAAIGVAIGSVLRAL